MLKKTKIAIIGLGYVGLPLLHLISKKKIHCYGFDIDKSKIELLKKNRSYISDLKNRDIKILKKNNLFDMNNLSKISESNLIIFCLPTPLNKKNEPDISSIKKAFNKIQPYLKKGQSIVLESTVYPGATKQIFQKSLSKKFNLGDNFFLGYSSERISPGQTDKKLFKFFLENTTKVISALNYKSLKKISFIYKKIFQSIHEAESIEIAEMSKLVENSYRAVNIGLVNELKIICKKLNININKVIKTASTKPFGFNEFMPGPGVGGHCIPIDPIFLKWIAKKNRISSKFIDLARLTNLKITNWVLDQILKNEPVVRNKNIKIKILIIGLAYKRDVNDLRESPSLKIFKYLHKLNNIVHYHDTKIEKILFKNKVFKSVSINKIRNYDIVVIGTDHSDLNKKYIFKNAKKIFDSRALFSNITSKKIINI